MEKSGVIVPTKTSDWVSQATILPKPKGKWRVCIDPRPLNKALKDVPVQLPTLDEVIPELGQSKVFTKLDLQKGFWHVQLDDESSKLTTFATPFGMYRWTRLPFGLKTSSEIFQRKLMTAIADLEGVICVADDIVVHAENDEVHDQRLKNLLQRCREVGIRLNKEKSRLRTNEMIYLGHKITSNGVEPDPQKIQAITNMPAPTNKGRSENIPRHSDLPCKVPSTSLHHHGTYQITTKG